MCLSDMPCASHLTFVMSLKRPFTSRGGPSIISMIRWGSAGSERACLLPWSHSSSRWTQESRQSQNPQPPCFPSHPLKCSAVFSTKHRPYQSKRPCRLTIVCDVEIGGFRPGAIARQGGGPHSHTVIPGWQTTQPAAPLQSKMPAGDAEVQLLENKDSTQK